VVAKLRLRLVFKQYKCIFWEVLTMPNWMLRKERVSRHILSTLVLRSMWCGTDRARQVGYGNRFKEFFLKHFERLDSSLLLSCIQRSLKLGWDCGLAVVCRFVGLESTLDIEVQPLAWNVVVAHFFSKAMKKLAVASRFDRFRLLLVLRYLWFVLYFLTDVCVESHRISIRQPWDHNFVMLLRILR